MRYFIQVNDRPVNQKQLLAALTQRIARKQLIDMSVLHQNGQRIVILIIIVLFQWGIDQKTDLACVHA